MLFIDRKEIIMKILIKHPETKPEELEILKLDLQNLSALLECWDIEVIKRPPFDELDIIILADGDGKLRDKQYNFEMWHGGIDKTVLVGTVLFVGINKQDQWIGLSNEQINFVKESFK
jgi:hypothetical protein